MIRRNARLRREYLYRKSLEGKEREEYERKRKIREALDGEGLFCQCFASAVEDICGQLASLCRFRHKYFL